MVCAMGVRVRPALRIVPVMHESTEHDGVTRIDIAPDADVRPGNPYEEPLEADQ